MRLVLLALFSFVLVAPGAADAARRDEPRSQASGRPQAAPKGAKLHHQPEAPRAAQAATPGRAAVAGRAATAANRVVGRGVGRSQHAGRIGDVRTQRSGIVVRGASAATLSREAAACTRQNGRTVCGGRRDGVAGWQAGLPQADYAQSDCPAGTFATLARGHENVIRCMPL
jgi:hypothetical protein